MTDSKYVLCRWLRDIKLFLTLHMSGVRNVLFSWMRDRSCG